MLSGGTSRKTRAGRARNAGRHRLSLPGSGDYVGDMTTLIAAAPAAAHPGVVPTALALPASVWRAIQRGVLCKCPRCGEGRLFRKWLKSVDACSACGQDWSHHRADDLPAYVAIIVTGHLLAPVMIAMTADFGMSPAAILAVLIPLSIAMMLGMLQSAKGAVIAVQWWHGLHGFVRERQPELVPEPAASSSGADLSRPE